MKVVQKKWKSNTWDQSAKEDLGEKADLVLFFGATELLEPNIIQEIQSFYPKAIVLGCSTAGEIFDTTVEDNTISLVAIHFEKTEIVSHSVNIDTVESSYDAGKNLSSKFDKNGLVHLFVLTEGLHINGTEFVEGMIEKLPTGVTVTGGLCGDGTRFEETLISLNGDTNINKIAAIGFYGEQLKVNYASVGGWDTFGPERVITKSKGNVLYELDNRNALDIYKKYLGKYADDLPASGLLFPLSLRGKNDQEGVVRTILGVNEEDKSLTFAGEMIEGSYAKLMKANFDRLIDGALTAAELSDNPENGIPDFAILISCIGRKLVLKQRIEEEVEVIRDMFGDKPILTGFYSYGEISPFSKGRRCELHNQTMTITTFTEL